VRNWNHQQLLHPRTCISNCTLSTWLDAAGDDQRHEDDETMNLIKIDQILFNKLI
jgi:hypothetical protein